MCSYLVVFDVSVPPPCQETGLCRLEMTGLLLGRWNLLLSWCRRDGSSLLLLLVSGSVKILFLPSRLISSSFPSLWLVVAVSVLCKAELECTKALWRAFFDCCWWLNVALVSSAPVSGGDRRRSGIDPEPAGWWFCWGNSREVASRESKKEEVKFFKCASTVSLLRVETGCLFLYTQILQTGLGFESEIVRAKT